MAMTTRRHTTRRTPSRPPPPIRPAGLSLKRNIVAAVLRILIGLIPTSQLFK